MSTPLTEEQIKEFKAKHGQLAAVTIGETTLVFRKPKRQEYDAWFEKRDEAPAQAALQLAQQCLVQPTYPEMLAALDDQPFALQGADGIMSALLDLAGLGSVSRKKL